MTRRIRQILGRALSRVRPQPRENPELARLVHAEPREWKHALQAVHGGTGVLIATGVGGHKAVTPVEGLLAVALTLRGAKVHVLLCDGVLPACLDCDAHRYPDTGAFAMHGPSQERCTECTRAGIETFKPLGVAVHTYSELLSPEDRALASRVAGEVPLDDIGSYTRDGVALGEHALAGTLRYFVRGTLDDEPDAEAVLRRFLEAAVLTDCATRRLIALSGVSTAVFHHGIYVPQGIVGEVSRRLGVHVVNWAPAYRKGCFLLSHDDTYHRVLMHESASNWEEIPWNHRLEDEIMAYLNTRWTGTQDWISFHSKPESTRLDIERTLGIDFSKPTIGLLTNVIWDAQVHYASNAFPTMLHWLMETIEYFRARPDLQLLVRVHPGEVMTTLPTRQRVDDEIARAFPSLPPNVFVVPPESTLSTYAAMALCDAALLFGTITGVELTSMGIPVVVAGEAWIRGKGITVDVSSASDYFAVLDSLPWSKRLEGADLERARKYAYHFFMRRMIPLSFMEPTDAWPPYRPVLGGLDDLRPGRSVGLDIICEGILAGGDFIYPAESVNAETQDTD